MCKKRVSQGYSLYSQRYQDNTLATGANVTKTLPKNS